MTMKRLFQIFILLLLPIGVSQIMAYNVLKWDSEIFKNEYGVIKHPDKKKKLPANCAMLRVKILPIMPPNFNMEDKTGGDNGKDLKGFKHVDYKKGYIYFFYQIDQDDPIQTLKFQADGYVTPIEKKVYIEPSGWYETTIFLEQEDWVTLKLKTTPGECDVLEEGKKIGTSNSKGLFECKMKLSKAFLFTFKKDGYEPLMETVSPGFMKARQTGEFDTINSVITIKRTFALQKIGAAKLGDVIIRTEPGATLYLRDMNDEEFGNGIIVPRSGVYEGSLTEGTKVVKIIKEGYYDNEYTFDVKKGIDFEKKLSLIPITGKLIVKSNPPGADVLVDGEKIGETPFNKSFKADIQIGNHTLQLRKKNYAELSPITITIDTVAPVRKSLDLSKTNNAWWANSQFFPHHYIETYYGMGVTKDKKFNHYIGANYTYIRHTIGFNISGMYGFNNKDIVATAGPALTLTTQSKTDLDLQLLLGAGYASILQEERKSRKGTWVTEAGLRFGFENAITDYPVSLWSVFMGAKYYDKKIVPTIGISLMPVGILALPYFKEESDFSHFFLDPMAGYAVKSHDAMVGGHFAWQGYNIGFYTSCMYGVLHGNVAAVAGPALHITPNTDIFDLSLYGGIGYGRTAYRTNHLAGDFGLRFAFSDDIFNWYNFSLGCTTYGGEWVPTFGLSLLPVKGLVELAILEEDYFPAHYTEAMAAYCFHRHEWMVGTNYSWIPSHLGLYGSFLVGLKHSATVNAGAVFRLTPDDCVVDLQLYQGTGWTKFGYNSVGGESGIRMGFQFEDLKFGIFSLNLGANYNKHDVAISFGISWGLVGTVATFGGLAALLY